MNGESTGACQANSTLGGCLVFTDTGSPYNSIPPVLISDTALERVSKWNRETSISREVQIADCAAAPSIPFNLTMVIGGVAFDVSPQDMMDRLVAPASRLCDISLYFRDFRDGIPGGHTDKRYQLPAPVIYLGNNWLRNFFVTYTLAKPGDSGQSATTSSMTIGCDAPGLRGRCSSMPSTPPSSPPAALRASLIVGISVPCAFLVLVLALTLFDRKLKMRYSCVKSQRPRSIQLNDKT